MGKESSLKLKIGIKRSGFTIVELLIVILIIGILAAITLVSYIGLTKKATEAGLISTLDTAKKQIELYKVEHGEYPTGKEDGTNCLTGNVSPSPDTKYCLKGYGDSVLNLTGNGSDYILIITKDNITYKITKDSLPTAIETESNPSMAASFARTWGGTISERGYSLISTRDNGYAITGNTYSYGPGANTMFLTKYDTNGNLSWNKTWGGTGDEYGFSLIQTSDNGYAITGYTNGYGAGSSDMFIAKFDNNGNLSWNKTLGGTDADEGVGLIQTSDNSYIIVGHTANYGSGYDDVFIAKFSSDGNLSWNKIWGGTSYDNGTSIAKTSDNGFIITGRTRSFGAGNYDMFIAKYDSNGNLSWNKTWGGTGGDYGYSIVQTKDGGYAITGHTSSYGAGSSDAFIAKFDAIGNISWNKTWGGSGNDYGRGVVQTSDDGYVITGNTTSYGAGSGDMFIVKFDTNGNLSWNKTWGGTSSESGYSLIQTRDNGYAVTGDTQSYGAGNYEVYLVKFDSEGIMKNCDTSICQTPTATIKTPTVTVGNPTATIANPTATIKTPNVTVGNPTAIVQTIIEP